MIGNVEEILEVQEETYYFPIINGKQTTLNGFPLFMKCIYIQ